MLLCSIVNDLSRARCYMQGWLSYNIRWLRAVSYFFLQSYVSIPYCNNNVVVCIALDEIRTRRILREKADCKQSTIFVPLYWPLSFLFCFPSLFPHFVCGNMKCVNQRQGQAKQGMSTWQKRYRTWRISERLRFTFAPNGKREFVPRDQVFPLIFPLLFIVSTRK